jgi:hypothetical protein
MKLEDLIGKTLTGIKHTSPSYPLELEFDNITLELFAIPEDGTVHCDMIRTRTVKEVVERVQNVF